MALEKTLKGEDLCSSISLRDRPGVDEDDPGVRPFLPRPESVQEHEIPDVAGYDGTSLGTGEGQEFSVGILVPVRAEFEYRDYIVSAFPQGLCNGGI
jgi:hypothetical protein